ncbi:hypothetical protein FJT64_006162 [Amphibalanus amphitrite]|uniref:Uncharacterized protein n=1 Tax=Amphibalanus amphitrite TaxID=1232801 RepID=A0A6A4VQ89_AMPAM|nr:hypothetical protein FJT64_006162 [Amphibalanus amphitrite]
MTSEAEVAGQCVDRVNRLVGHLSCKQFIQRYGYRYCSRKYVQRNCCASQKRLCSGRNQKKEVDYVGQDRNHVDLIRMEWRGAGQWKANWGFLCDGYEKLDRDMSQSSKESTFQLRLEFSEPRSVTTPADVFFWRPKSARKS